MNKKIWGLLVIGIIVILLIVFFSLSGFPAGAVTYNKNDQVTQPAQVQAKPAAPLIPPLDIAAYNAKLIALANNPVPKPIVPKKDKNGNDIPVPVVPAKPNLWPVKTAYPDAGAILPFSRIVAYYGNLYSTKMGVLGQYPEDVMLQKLQGEVAKWEAADPSTPVIPALQYIAVVAQGSPGADKKYRFRMPDSEIDKVLAMANKIHGLMILDVQVGLSNVQTEIPLFQKYLVMPNVELAIDPEFSMKTGQPPGKVVGTFDATDINFVSNYLATLVQQNNLTPKVLIVHRFTEDMVTNYQNIKTPPEVQIVMDMDGWGGQAKKINTYKQFIYKEPVEFTGFKLFYKNDVLDPGSTMLTPTQLLKLNPQPIYIQYQ